MIFKSLFSRDNVLWKVIACYLLPMIVVILFSTFDGDIRDSWSFFSLWLFLSFFGTLVLFLMMVRYEVECRSANKQIVSPSPSTESLEEEQVENQIEVDRAKAENEELKAKVEKLEQELNQSHLDFQQKELYLQQLVAEAANQRVVIIDQLDQLGRQQRQIREFQESIAEQKGAIEKRQQQIVQLETKVGDLTYEIKTLLKLAETHSAVLNPKPTEEYQPAPLSTISPHPQFNFSEVSSLPFDRQIKSAEEASIQLKRSLDTAQKITGSYHFNSHRSSLSEFPADGFALDLRRLCDSLRSENNCTILLYSPKENQVLFISNQIKTLLGWSPDKFIQNFSDILIDTSTWRQAIGSLSVKSEAEAKLSFRARSGQDFVLSAYMGLIPTGIFKHHLIAILF